MPASHVFMKENLMRQLTFVMVAFVFAISGLACSANSTKEDSDHAATNAHEGHPHDHEGHHHHDADERHGHSAEDMNAKFLGPDVDAEAWRESFEREDRDVFRHRQAIVDALNLEPGQTVADIGAGTGGFLSLLHDKIGDAGKVYAVEISEVFVDYITQRANDEGLTQVEAILNTQESTMLPDNSVDVLLLVNVYHHLENPQILLTDFKRVLKPGGTLAIVDFDKVPGESSEWIMDHMRLDKQGHIDELTTAGFLFDREVVSIDFEENFMLVFALPDAS